MHLAKTLAAVFLLLAVAPAGALAASQGEFPWQISGGIHIPPPHH